MQSPLLPLVEEEVVVRVVRVAQAVQGEALVDSLPLALTDQGARVFLVAMPR